jgi:hypothetical protein
VPEIRLSVIIPVGPDEKAIPEGLLKDLQALPDDSQVIFVGCYPETQTNLLTTLPAKYKCIFSTPGRAVQMNAGADEAAGHFLWFLHLDSRFEPELSGQLLQNLQSYPDRLHYNLLEFISDGKQPMGVNAVGANLRSKLFGVPFGDQGFAISKELFVQIGAYPETASYGEDHLFVWYARQQGVKLLCNSHKLQTSARKYEEKGWLKLTLKYQKLWLLQALPEFWKLIKLRYLPARCQR